MKRKPRNIIIALPAYTGLVHCGTMRSLLYDVAALMNAGHHVRVVEEVGNADIARCRSMIVAKFLSQPQATHLVMIDTDVCWEHGGLVRLVEAGVDFVAGAYPMRVGDGTQFHMRMLPREVHTADPKTGLVEVEAVPAGFMCLSRSMLERMRDRHPETKFSFRECPGGVAWDLFEAYWETDADGLRHKYGEDYSFCKRWRDMGGQVWVDPSISMGHLGTKIWKGRLGDCFVEPPAKDVAA
jgi:hypothetical protein